MINELPRFSLGSRIFRISALSFLNRLVRVYGGNCVNDFEGLDMSYYKIQAKHFYRLQKLMGLGNQLFNKMDLARIILNEKIGDDEKILTKKLASKIIREKMIETGVIFSGKTKKELLGESVVYFIQQQGGSKCVKIGVTSNIEDRLKKLQTGSPYKLRVISKIIAKDKSHALYIEKSLHEQLSKYRLSGEWFSSISVDNILSDIA